MLYEVTPLPSPVLLCHSPGYPHPSGWLIVVPALGTRERESEEHSFLTKI